MRFKKFVICFFFIMFWIIILPTNFELAINHEELSSFSNVALLVEKNTGNIIYEKNVYEKKYPASTTKIMTAILALENCNLTDTATVNKTALSAVPYGYTTSAIQVGEKLTIEQLLNLALIPSANDATNVLAEHISGSIDNFAIMMNEKAKELGCKNTNFTNPSGIHNENHYSTAYDLYLIAKYALENETFKEIIKKTTYSLPISEKYQKEDRNFVTTNSMLRTGFKNYYNENVYGIKTGYTEHSRDCIVAGAKKDDIDLICVILDSGYASNGLREKYLDCNTLFKFGFDNYTTKKIISQGDIYKQLEISLV